MTCTSFVFKHVAAVVLLAGAGMSEAAIVVYTTQAPFLAAISAPGVDTFTGFSITGPTPGPLTRTAGPYTYTAAVSESSFFGAGTTANPWLATNTAFATITFNAFPGSVVAIGGLFFGSNLSGSFQTGDITMTATDAGGSVSQTTIAATTSSFVGFVSDGPMTSLTVTAVQPTTGFVWPTVDNLTLAVANTDRIFANGFE